MVRDLRLGTLVVATLLASGCGSAVGSELNAACTTTSECPSGATCVDGRCTREDAGSFDVSTFDVADVMDTAETPCPSFTFPLSETQVTFSVPSGVRFMHVKAWGAGGNDEGQCGAGKLDGGLGGFTEAVFEVKPGDPSANADAPASPGKSARASGSAIGAGVACPACSRAAR